jgi:hypothetical protein
LQPSDPACQHSKQLYSSSELRFGDCISAKQCLQPCDLGLGSLKRFGQLDNIRGLALTESKNKQK